MFILVPSSGHEAPGRVPRCLVNSLAIVVAFLGGCSGSQHGPPVEAERAREILKTALDVWKKGDTPASLSNNTPAITAQDLDWLGGAKLVDYEVTGEGKSLEATRRVPVTLTLKMANGKEAKKKVNYIVATSPYLSVFRALE
jgi:hypothetical protein